MTQAPGTAGAQRRGSFQNAVTVARLRGVPIRIDWSWLVIAALVCWLFYQRIDVRLEQVGEASLAVSLSAALVATLLFFASLLAHELGHAFTSLDRDIPVQGITLFLLGGVTESTEEPRRPSDEFIIVGIGPYTSFVLAAAFAIVHTFVEAHQPYALVAGYLAWANLLLAIFNVVPGYPLDGGRLLRSVLWALTRRPHQATRWAARVGQGFAGLLVGFGLWLLATSGGGGFNGIWEILIGVFLFQGAAGAHRRARLQERLAGRRVADAMSPLPPALDGDLTLREAVGRVQTRPGQPWPVGDPVQGVVRLTDFDRVSADRWDTVRVREIASAPSGAVVEEDQPLGEILSKLAGAPQQTLFVIRGGALVGVLTASAVMEGA